MKPLSGLDSLFLHLETAATPMHVGALHLLEAAPGERDDFVARVRSHVADRLHLLPVFTRRLAPMPLGFANPVWVEADEVDLDYHVRRIRLPAPGTHAQLEATVAQLHGQRLDRSRPLWLFHVIEGLESGQRAVYTKVHHAALDGAAGVALAQVLLDSSPASRAVAPRARRGKHPGLVALIGAALRASAAQTAGLVRHVPEAVRALAQLAQSGEGGGGLAALRRSFSTEATTLATMTLASLATDVADPHARLAALRRGRRAQGAARRAPVRRGHARGLRRAAAGRRRAACAQGHAPRAAVDAARVQARRARGRQGMKVMETASNAGSRGAMHYPESGVGSRESASRDPQCAIRAES